MGNRDSLQSTSIHILDDYSLLNIFYLYRLAIFDGDGYDDEFIPGGRDWDRERWWYKLAQVCQRWRTLMLGSTCYLGLCLVCTHGTPVADMLAHSPPLPLAIDYSDEDRDVTAEEDEILLALKQRDRVRRIRLHLPVPELQRLIMVVDEEYAALEYLIMVSSTVDESTALMLPETLQAPRLHHLLLFGFAIPMESRLLTNAVGLISLALTVPQSAYFQPSILLQQLSFMPQLETLLIDFLFPVPDHDVEGQVMHTPITTHVILPNLRFFSFRGVNAYLEAIICRITTPCLESLSIEFFKQRTFSVPRLLQFISTTENLRFKSAKFKFSGDDVDVEVYPRDAADTGMYSLSVCVRCSHLGSQVSSVAQIFNSLGQIFSTVEHLNLELGTRSRSSEEHNEVDRTEWHKLFRSFSKVKTLRVGDGLVEELSCSLRVDNGEVPLELLPDLQSLTYSGSGHAGDSFTSFIDARQNAGHPVTLHRS